MTIDLTPAERASGADPAAGRNNDPGAARPFEATATGSAEAKPAPSANDAFTAPAKAADEGDGRKDVSKETTAQAQPSSAHGFGRKAETPAASVSPTARNSTPEPPKAGSKPAGSPVAAPVRKSRGGFSAVVAGILGGVVALGLAYGLQQAGLLPGAEAPVSDAAVPVATTEDLDALRAEIADLREQATTGVPAGEPDPALGELGGRLDALAASIEELRAAPPAPADGAGGDPAALEAVNQTVAALEARFAEWSATADGGDAVAAVEARLGDLERAVADQTQGAASSAEAQAAIDSRLATIEERLAALGETVEGQPRMALAIAATALKAAVDRGGPFATELDTYAAVAPDASSVEPLRPMAAAGVATRAEIESEAGAAATAMIEAARPVDRNAGLIDRLMTSAQSLVAVRPIGAVEGEGVPAIAARFEAAVLAGEYERAISEYRTLPEPAKAASAEFVAKLGARQEADRLVETALSGALQPAGAAPAGGG